MGEKYLLALLIAVLITSLSSTLAEEIECNFGQTEYYRGRTFDVLFNYGCTIKSMTQNSGGLNSITGTHEAGMNDSDVKIVYYNYPYPNKDKTDLKNFDSIFCQQFPNLEKLYFIALIPASITVNALHKCDNLEILKLESAGIRKLPENFLKNLHRLEELYLGYNKINSLSPNFFKSLSELRVLHLSENNIQVLHLAWFENLQELKFLYMDYNKVTELPRNVFTPLLNLKQLFLDGNELRVIHADSFGVHRKLTVVGLLRNNLNEIDEKFLDILIACPRTVKIEAYSNECMDGFYSDKSTLKQDLAKCIENYQPRFDYPSEYPTFEIEENRYCGTKGVQKRSVGSDYTKPHDYPWLAGVLNNRGHYLFGGTLITDRKVVTAARFIHPKYESKARTANEIKVLLGAHNLSDTSERGRKLIDVKAIHVHHYWRQNLYDYDIAVIVLSNPVQFDRFVLPICQISSHPSIIEKRSNMGIVVDYEYSEQTNILENIPKSQTVSMMTYQDCKKKYPTIAEHASPRTFCGDWANRTFACYGDEGSALMIKYRGHYYLRGILSTSKHSGDYLCGENKVSIFTDIMFFTPWINDIAV